MPAFTIVRRAALTRNTLATALRSSPLLLHRRAMANIAFPTDFVGTFILSSQGNRLSDTIDSFRIKRCTRL